MLSSLIYSLYLIIYSKPFFEIFLTLIVGTQAFFFLGLLSIYIGSIFKESKRRPLYIIEEKIGFETSQ